MKGLKVDIQTYKRLKNTIIAYVLHCPNKIGIILTVCEFASCFRLLEVGLFFRHISMFNLLNNTHFIIQYEDHILLTGCSNCTLNVRNGTWIIHS